MIPIEIMKLYEAAISSYNFLHSIIWLKAISL
jgi:hypothetical protein